MKTRLKSKRVCGIRLLFLSAMLSGSLHATGQISAAPYPIEAGTSGSSFSYSNTQNSQSCGNYYGRSTNDVAYRFTLTAPMDVVINHCGSSVSDTYLYLLDASGTLIISNDDYSGTGCCSNAYHSRITQALPAGTYYVISEGYNSNGSITTSITGTVAGLNGDTFQTAIVAGIFGSSFSYTNNQNTSDFTNTFGRTTNEVFYRFSVTIQMDVTITHCGSSLSDTYLHLLDANGSSTDYNDDYSGTGACSNTYHSIIKKTLAPGTYYVVSEGYNSNGGITTNISGTPGANSIIGNTFQNPIIAGTYDSPFSYANSQNTADFTNTYGQSSNDLFYRFTLSVPMIVTINHCGSSVTDTYLHLLDENGIRIAYNNDYNGDDACSNANLSCLKSELLEGTYYVVSEGYSSNGVILTTVSGELPISSISYLYDASGNRTDRLLSGSTLAAAPLLRSSGAYVKKGDAIPDPGRDGSKDEGKLHSNDTVEGVKNLLQTAITVYPNPTDGLLTVSGFPEGATGEIRLYDSAGRNLYTRKIGSQTETIDLSGHAGGVYTALISIDGETVAYKIIKQKK